MRFGLERVGERNVPRRSLGGNTTPSGGLLICSIGVKASATGGGTTAGDMAGEFVVIETEDSGMGKVLKTRLGLDVTLPIDGALSCAVGGVDQETSR